MKNRILKITTILIISLIATSVLFACNKKETKIIKNSEFLATTDLEKTTIKDWNAFNASKDDSKIIERNKSNGTIIFSSAKETSSYLYQEIALEKGYYIITANIKVDSNFNNFEKLGENTPGLTIGVLQENSIIGIKEAKQTRSWKEVKQAINVENKGTYKFVVGIGADKIGQATGTARVKNVNINKATKQQALSIGVYPTNVGRGYNSSVYNKNINSIVLNSLMSIFTLIMFILFGLFLSKKIKLKNKNNSDNNNDIKNIIPFKERTNKEKINSIVKSTPFIITIITLIAFTIRFIFISTMPMLFNNLQTYESLAKGLANNGIFEAYSKLGSNLEFGYLYIFYIIGLFAKAVNLSSSTFGYSMLLRLPDLVAEILICYVIFMFLLENTSKKQAIIGSLIYAVIPTFFISAFNLRLTSIGILFAILTILSLIKGKNYLTFIYYFIGSMFEYSLVVLLPLIIVIFIIVTIKENSQDLKLQILLSFIFSVLLFIILAIPFDFNFIKDGKPFYFMTIIFNNLKHSMLSESTLNLYSMLTLSRLKTILALVILTGIVLVTIYGFFTKAYYLGKSNKNVLLISAYSFLTVGTIGAMVEPLYTQIGIVILFIYALTNKERRIYSVLASIATLFTINEFYIYSISGTLTKNRANNVIINANDPLFIILSLFMVLSFIYLSYVVYKIIIKEDEKYFTDEIYKKEHIKVRLEDFKKSIQKIIVKKEKKIKAKVVKNKRK